MTRALLAFALMVVPAAAAADDRAMRVAFQTDSAIGVSGKFYNHLLGARLDVCAVRASTTCLGAYLGYANLKGQDGRAHSALIAFLIDHRAQVSGVFSIPIRFGSGWLVKNGPFLRASAGLGFRVSERVDLTFDLLAPTLWVTGKQPVYSLDLAGELAVRF